VDVFGHLVPVPRAIQLSLLPLQRSAGVAAAPAVPNRTLSTPGLSGTTARCGDESSSPCGVPFAGL
jgi:hypothetical protein